MAHENTARTCIDCIDVPSCQRCSSDLRKFSRNRQIQSKSVKIWIISRGNSYHIGYYIRWLSPRVMKRKTKRSSVNADSSQAAASYARMRYSALPNTQHIGHRRRSFIDCHSTIRTGQLDLDSILPCPSPLQVQAC